MIAGSLFFIKKAPPTARKMGLQVEKYYCPNFLFYVGGGVADIFIMSIYGVACEFEVR